MNEEEKKEFEEAKVKTKEAEDALEAEKTSREEDKAAHKETIAEKDAIIEQKKNDVIGARKKYQKLSDMSAEEKEALTEKELELQTRQEEQDERQEKFEKDQKELADKESNARRNEAIGKLAGDDKELAEKITANYDRIKDADKASTQEEISALANDAFNMLGVPKKEGVEGAIADGGDGSAGEAKEGDFAETAKGKNIAESLNLEQAKTEVKTEDAPKTE